MGKQCSRYWPQAVFVIFQLRAKSMSLKILSPGLLFSTETTLAPLKHEKAQEKSGNQALFSSREYIGLGTRWPQSLKKVKNMHIEACSCLRSALTFQLKIKAWLHQHNSDPLFMAATSGAEFQLSFAGQRAEKHSTLWSHLDYSREECRDS